MGPAPDQQRLSSTERANLVAYLDGELDGAEARVIATKLTQSATARREVESLQKTWELLDHLSRPRASDTFTERTLSEVRHFDERGDRLGSAFSTAAGRSLKAALWVVASLTAFAFGYALTRWAWPDPTARLARDLSIAEHLDEYRDAGTAEFLNQLVNSPEFGGERGD